MATMKDVAKLAGVSHGTVSNVINGVKTVNSDIVARVEAAMKELGYHPDAKARSLRSSKTDTIGIVLPDIFEPLYSVLYTEIEQHFHGKEYNVCLYLTNDCPDTEYSALNHLQQQRAALTIIVTCLPESTEFFDELIFGGMKLLFVQRKPKELYLRTFIGLDYFRSIAAVTACFLRRQIKNICLLTGDRAFSCEMDAISGFRQAFSDTHSDLNTDSIQSVQNNKESAFRVAAWWLQREPAPAVIITLSDAHKKGVLAALEMFQQDISTINVVSFVNDSWTLSCKNPALKMIHKNYFQISEAVVQKAENLLAGHAAMESSSTLMYDETYNSDTSPQIMKSRQYMVPLKAALLEGASSCAARFLLPCFSRETGIPVEINTFSYYEMQELFSNQLAGKGSYDLIQTNVACFHSLASSGLFYDLDKLSPYVSCNFDSDILTLYGVEDNILYGMPYMLDTQILFYRKDLFEDIHNQRLFYEHYRTNLSVPASWFDYSRVASFFTRSLTPGSPVKYGTTLGGAPFFSVYGFMPLLWEAGTHFFDEYGHPLPPGQGDVFALKQFLNMFSYADPSAVNWGWKEQTTQFIQGDAAMMPLYQAHYMDFLSNRTHTVNNKIGVAALPGNQSALGGWCLTIPHTSKQPDNAAAFLSWLSRKENSIAYNVLGGSMPAKYTLSSHELKKAYPWFSCAYENMENARPMVPPASKISQFTFENIISENIQSAICGKNTAEETVKKINSSLCLALGNR